MAVGYDALIAAGVPADMPMASDVGGLLTPARRYRRALQARADQVKEHRAAEINREIANQMEEVTQTVSGQLYQLDKAIGTLERVQSAAIDYPNVMARMAKIVAAVRAR